MIGEGVPAVGGPHDLDPLLTRRRRCRTEPGRVREYEITRDRPGDRDRARASSSPPGRTTAPSPGPSSARPRATRCACTSSTRGSHPHTIHFHGIHPAEHGRRLRDRRSPARVHYEFEARPAGFHLYHCHATPLKKHIHKGLYGAFIIDPKEPRPPAQELVMVMNGYDTDGDGEQQLLHRQRPELLLREATRSRCSRSKLVRHLPREPDRVRPDQLVPPARGLLPLPAERHGRPLGVHRHGDAVPGPARRDRDRVRQRGPVHVPRAPVRVHRARLDGLLQRVR